MIFNYMCFDVFMSYVWLLTQMVVTLLVTEHPSTPKKASNITRSIIRMYPFACVFYSAHWCFAYGTPAIACDYCGRRRVLEDMPPVYPKSQPRVGQEDALGTSV